MKISDEVMIALETQGDRRREGQQEESDRVKVGRKDAALAAVCRYNVSNQHDLSDEPQSDISSYCLINLVTF